MKPIAHIKTTVAFSVKRRKRRKGQKKEVVFLIFLDCVLSDDAFDKRIRNH